MAMLTVKPENGRLALPDFSNFIDSFFENEFPRFTRSDIFKTPALVNIKDTKDSYQIEVAAPGFKKDDFRIRMEGNVLTIGAETKTESETTEHKFTRREFNLQSFSRSFTLPRTIDTSKIAASYESGMLHVTLPKKDEAKVNPVIEVKVS